MRLRDQFRRHSVALISLAVALSSLAYNTWRNEKSEANRNLRMAGVELLLKLGELDQVVFFSHYDRDSLRGSPREGWAIALVVRDLGALAPPPTSASTAALVEVWERNWSGLGNDATAVEQISASIDRAREDVRTMLSALD